MSSTKGELRRAASTRRNAETEAFRADEGVKASQIQEAAINTSIFRPLYLMQLNIPMHQKQSPQGTVFP